MILACVGGLGSGKTNFMVSGAYAFFPDRNMRANFWLDSDAFPNYRRVEYWDELLSFHDGLVLWSEPHLDMDSRAFSKNVELTEWITISRHYLLDFWLDTQDESQIDVRVRTLIDILFMMREISEGVSEVTPIIDPYRLSIKMLAPRIYVHNPEIYQYYDTHEIIRKLKTRSPADAALAASGGVNKITSKY